MRENEIYNIYREKTHTHASTHTYIHIHIRPSPDKPSRRTRYPRE